MQKWCLSPHNICYPHLHHPTMTEHHSCPYCFKELPSEWKLRLHLRKCTIRKSLDDCPIVQSQSKNNQLPPMPIQMVVDQNNVATLLQLNSHNASVNSAPERLHAHSSIKTMAIKSYSESKQNKSVTHENDIQFKNNDSEIPDAFY